MQDSDVCFAVCRGQRRDHTKQIEESKSENCSASPLNIWHLISRNIFTLSIIFHCILVLEALIFTTVLFLKNQNEASYSLPASVQLKNVWSYTYILPYNQHTN